MICLGLAVDWTVFLCSLPAGRAVQALGGPQHLVNHGTHALAVGGLHQSAAVVKSVARGTQRKGLGRQPAFGV